MQDLIADGVHAKLNGITLAMEGVAMLRLVILSLITTMIFTAVSVNAQMREGFSLGPYITGFGPAAKVPGAEPLAEDVSFRVRWDTANSGGQSGTNTTLTSAARFLNMHGQAGVPLGRMQLAVVVHGSAVDDILTDRAYAARHAGATNPNADLISALNEAGVRFILCGQSAAARGVDAADVLDGVEIALSAMTAHAVLAQEGYSLNPF